MNKVPNMMSVFAQHILNIFNFMIKFFKPLMTSKTKLIHFLVILFGFYLTFSFQIELSSMQDMWDTSLGPIPMTLKEQRFESKGESFIVYLSSIGITFLLCQLFPLAKIV
jgi:hypothetical protein